MKKVLLFASLSIAALSISSCSDDDSTPVNEYAEAQRADCKAGRGEFEGQDLSDQACDCAADKLVQYNVTSEEQADQKGESDPNFAVDVLSCVLGDLANAAQ